MFAESGEPSVGEPMQNNIVDNWEKCGQHNIFPYFVFINLAWNDNFCAVQ